MSQVTEQQRAELLNLHKLSAKHGLQLTLKDFAAEVGVSLYAAKQVLSGVPSTGKRGRKPLPRDVSGKIIREPKAKRKRK